MKGLDDRALAQVAEYFQALAEPTRLLLLNALRDGEMSVGDLTRLAECSQANVSKHLSMLAKGGFVERRSAGTSVYYGISDPDIYKLCDLVCGQIAKRLVAQGNVQQQFKRAVRAA
jgi:DNA-binding transcriptional ArsR family regulator